MSLPVNPFELAEYLISNNYRIPIPVESSLICKNVKENFISLDGPEVVDLGNLLTSLRTHILILQCENAALKADLKTVTGNGSVRVFVDEYYSNESAVDESFKIREKWFSK